MESLFSYKDIYQCNTGYSIRFTLPDGTPVRLSNTDKTTLLRVANELYRHKAERTQMLRQKN